MNLELFGLHPSTYSIAIGLFIRLLGLIYIVVYIPFLFQIRGLFGKEGIRPIAEYLSRVKDHLGKKRFYYLPTLFWLNASDRTLIIFAWSGVLLGLLLFLGLSPVPILFLLYVVHLSLTSAGQEFLSFGWETFLLEITLAAILLVMTVPWNIFGWIGLNFLLFRFIVQAGASKLLSGDQNWRNLTALSYHYLTQPLPNRTAWYFHKLPLWFHKLSALAMFYIELIVPIAIFAPPEIRFLACIQLIGLQLGIWATGNFSYLNHLTVVLSLILLHNGLLEPIFGSIECGKVEASSLTWYVIGSLLGIIFLILQIMSFLQMFFPSHFFHSILRVVQPFHMAHPHGIFAIMTTKRYEIIIEGSAEGEIWHEYHFFYKPGDLTDRPRRVSPYQPRIDWQAWFLPFEPFVDQFWFQSFLMQLLYGTPTVLQLLKHNPFTNQPPLFVRALMYDYEFTTYQEKKQTGNWWKRKLIREYAPAMCLLERKLQN